MRRLSCLLIVGFLGATAALASVEDTLQQASAAESGLDAGRALELYLMADGMRPGDVAILQKIARQYSDLVLDQSTDEARRRFAGNALVYAQRAEAIDPANAVSVLSLAIAHGKLAAYSDNRTKVRYSRLVKEEAERALALDPDYAWAHHILGRWHREVAALSALSRGFVGVFYGGLPPASPDAALIHLQRAVELEPGELNHHLELGFVLAAAGRDAEARKAWAHGLAMPSRGKHDDSAKAAARAALLARD